jgi:hypothetical protein
MKMRPPLFWKIGIALLMLGLTFVTLGVMPAKADDFSQTGPQPTPGAPPIPLGAEPNANCLMCHSDPDFKGSFQDGEMVSLYVSDGEYRQSVHGAAGLECVACHTAISRYPHHEEEQVSCLDCHGEDGGKADTFVTLRVQLPYENHRAMTLEINEACRTCHEQEFEVADDSAHMQVLESGNTEAPVCVDCHSDHNITPPAEPRSRISQTCATCHQSVYSSYRSSVHGAALENEANLDVPSCINCHGVHSVRGPRDPSFRNDSIIICGGCHNDRSLMDKYAVSTDVFNTYLDDFHGRTVELFREQQGGIASNKAVCFDCHGIHSIRRPDDPLSSVYPDNLQHTCQQCHSSATKLFPTAWLGHVRPTWEQTPVLYVVNLAYQVLIPFTLGGFVFYIGLDAHKRWSDRRQIIRKALAEENLDANNFTQDDSDTRK